VLLYLATKGSTIGGNSSRERGTEGERGKIHRITQVTENKIYSFPRRDRSLLTDLLVRKGSKRTSARTGNRKLPEKKKSGEKKGKTETADLKIFYRSPRTSIKPLLAPARRISRGA